MAAAGWPAWLTLALCVAGGGAGYAALVVALRAVGAADLKAALRRG
jgi:hypothetical protein